MNYNDLNSLPYWEFEEIIKITNEYTKEDEEKRTKAEKEQNANMPNVPNVNSISKDMNSMVNKFKK